MVFARTSKAAKRLSEDIKNNNFHKKYLAVVEGMIEGSRTLSDMLYYDENKKKSFLIKKKDSKEAILTYNFVDYVNGKTLLDISLKTGRHHQIRCQLSNIGHPIVGDVKYGSSIAVGDKYALTAYSLSFIHPTKKEEMVFKYIPDDSFYKEFNIKK